MALRNIPEEVQNRLGSWHSLYWFFTIIHYFFGIGGVLSSAIAAGIKTDLDAKTIWSIIAAVSIAIIGFIKPDASYQKYVCAWRLLDEKVNQYRHGLITISALLDAMTDGEKLIGQYRANPEQDEQKRKPR